MKIIAATQNKNKVREFGEILSGFEILTEKDAGVDIDVEETGTTFEENSMLKAKAVFAATGLPSIADDSGLEVDALGGEPGIYSARYGGAGLDDEGRVRLLLKNMENVADSDRTARFVCAITYIDSDGVITVRGECEGVITRAPRGQNGFGYDPVFYIESLGKTTAELPADEKNAVSHRGKALRLLKEKLNKSK